MIFDSDIRPCEHCGTDIAQDDTYTWIHLDTDTPDCLTGDTVAE